MVRFKFFMLQADVLPNMGFSATRKRLIKEYNCSITTSSAGDQSEGSSVDGEGENLGGDEL